MPDESMSRKILIRKLRALGHSGPLSGGRHQFMIKDEKKIAPGVVAEVIAIRAEVIAIRKGKKECNVIARRYPY